MMDDNNEQISFPYLFIALFIYQRVLNVFSIMKRYLLNITRNIGLLVQLYQQSLYVYFYKIKNKVLSCNEFKKYEWA